MGFMAMEFWGDGDPFFGGRADDRPLLKSGLFVSVGGYRRDEVAEFATRAEAERAAHAASNLRERGFIGTFERAGDPIIRSPDDQCPIATPPLYTTPLAESGGDT